MNSFSSNGCGTFALNASMATSTCSAKRGITRLNKMKGSMITDLLSGIFSPALGHKSFPAGMEHAAVIVSGHRKEGSLTGFVLT